MMSSSSGSGGIREFPSMEDERELSFDFEVGLENNVVTPQINPVRNSGGGKKATQGRKNYRQTVCRHWLRGLCMKGDECEFLHQFDMTRMPVCRFFAKFEPSQNSAPCVCNINGGENYHNIRDASTGNNSPRRSFEVKVHGDNIGRESYRSPCWIDAALNYFQEVKARDTIPRIAISGLVH